MKCNVGKTEQIVRMVIGAAIVLLGLYLRSWWGLIDKLGRVEWHFTVTNPLRTVLAQLTHTAPHTIIYII